MRWFLLLVAACGSSPTDAIEVTPAQYDTTTMQLTDIADGDPIDLSLPPQGGFVIFVGARVKHLDDASAVVRGTLYDAAGTKMLSMDGRAVQMHQQKDGSWLPDLTSYTNVANIAVCPSTTTTDLFNQPMTLEVSVTESKSGRMGYARRRVVPSCRQTNAMQKTLCECECAANFSIGKCT
jgi:hypothetical protein